MSKRTQTPVTTSFSFIEPLLFSLVEQPLWCYALIISFAAMKQSSSHQPSLPNAAAAATAGHVPLQLTSTTHALAELLWRHGIDNRVCFTPVHEAVSKAFNELSKTKQDNNQVRSHTYWFSERVRNKLSAIKFSRCATLQATVMNADPFQWPDNVVRALWESPQSKRWVKSIVHTTNTTSTQNHTTAATMEPSSLQVSSLLHGQEEQRTYCKRKRDETDDDEKEVDSKLTASSTAGDKKQKPCNSTTDNIVAGSDSVTPSQQLMSTKAADAADDSDTSSMSVSVCSFQSVAEIVLAKEVQLRNVMRHGAAERVYAAERKLRQAQQELLAREHDLQSLQQHLALIAQSTSSKMDSIQKVADTSTSTSDQSTDK